MQTTIHYLLHCLLFTITCGLLGCYSITDSEKDVGTDTEQIADTGEEADSNAVMDTESESITEADSDTGEGFDTEADSDTGEGFDTEADSDTGEGFDTEADSETEIHSDTETDSDPVADTDTDITGTDVNDCPGLNVVKQTMTVIPGLDLQDYYGSAVAHIGDLDGDGIPDIAVGAPGDDDLGTGFGASNGAVYIQFMRSDGTVRDFAKISNTSGGEPEEGGESEEGFGGNISNYAAFGSAVTGIGDINGDDVPDIAVGAYLDNSYKGAVWILMLNEDGTVADFFTIKDASGTAMDGLMVGYSAFGGSLAKLENLQGGVKLAVGAYSDIVGCTDVDNKKTCGAVWTMDVYSDGTVESIKRIGMGSSHNPDLPLEAKDYFGFAMSSIGDFDGNNVNDLVVSALGDDDGGEDKGAVYLLMMNESGAVDSFMKISDTNGKFSGELGDDSFGYSVSGLGDFDNDSVSDIAVGVPGYDDGKGGYWILLLNEDGTVKKYVLFADGLAGITLGTFYEDDSVGSALTVADLDTTDGVSDIIVGAEDYSTFQGATWVFRTKAPVQKVRDIPSAIAVENDAKLKNHFYLTDIFKGYLLDFTISDPGKTSLVQADIDSDFSVDLTFTAGKTGSSTIVFKAEDTNPFGPTTYSEATLEVTVNPLSP